MSIYLLVSALQLKKRGQGGRIPHIVLSASQRQGQNVKLSPACSLCHGIQFCHFLGWHVSDLK